MRSKVTYNCIYCSACCIDGLYPVIIEGSFDFEAAAILFVTIFQDSTDGNSEIPFQENDKRLDIGWVKEA